MSDERLAGQKLKWLSNGSVAGQQSSYESLGFAITYWGYDASRWNDDNICSAFMMSASDARY